MAPVFDPTSTGLSLLWANFEEEGGGCRYHVPFAVRLHVGMLCVCYLTKNWQLLHVSFSHLLSVLLLSAASPSLAGRPLYEQEYSVRRVCVPLPAWRLAFERTERYRVRRSPWPALAVDPEAGLIGRLCQSNFAREIRRTMYTPAAEVLSCPLCSG